MVTDKVEVFKISAFFAFKESSFGVKELRNYMKYSGIGGQAVMEGVMMKNKDAYAVAVRTPDRNIVVDTGEYPGIVKNKKLRKLPFVRGVINFVESLALGMKTLTFSASFFEEEEAESGQKPKDAKREKREENMMMGGSIAIALLLAVGIFMVLPYYLSLIFKQYIQSAWLLALIEGLIRMVLFLAYVAGISLVPDIKRVYMYHGAEHKCINCIEHGMDLTVDNVRKSSRLHKRCGTSFLFLVVFISVIFFMFIQTDVRFLRLLLRILLIPVIAGISYEFIRLAGRSDHWLVNLFSKPGLCIQKITTREPSDDMIEVGIAAVEAVFDWKTYVKEMRQEQRMGR